MKKSYDPLLISGQSLLYFWMSQKRVSHISNNGNLGKGDVKMSWKIVICGQPLYENIKNVPR